MLTAYVASIFCNVAILPGWADTFNFAVNPTDTSIVNYKSNSCVVHVISYLAVNCIIEGYLILRVYLIFDKPYLHAPTFVDTIFIIFSKNIIFQ